MSLQEDVNVDPCYDDSKWIRKLPLGNAGGGLGPAKEGGRPRCAGLTREPLSPATQVASLRPSSRANIYLKVTWHDVACF